jgi:hypothetical protein
MSLYLDGQANPKSVVISPTRTETPVCEPDRVADQISCSDATVYCRSPTEKVVLRIVASGEILFFKSSCADLALGAKDAVTGNADPWNYADMMTNLFEDESTYKAKA